ncbi:cubilin [Fopius arisanus]|uniref:Cubilin n=2 Tax=Fopius arisanus TaxID=64838 RepID=A0A9R1TVM3_9HYME|nr:PREDICTED: cubilin-like [Fopius arisanus]
MQSSRWLIGISLVLGILISINMTTGTQRISAVKLTGGYMEIVEEDVCSGALLRLTCRSLRAFIFVLQAEFHRKSTKTCGSSVRAEKRAAQWYNYNSGIRKTITIELRGNYLKDEDDESGPVVDLRKSFNRKCSGQHHCRFTVAEDHPGGAHWPTADLRLKYACIPEGAVKRYCNTEVRINRGEAGYIKSPGYPLYYPGEYACGWAFKTAPGQRVVLQFHDFNIRSPEADGNCEDLIRIQDSGQTIFESCGTRIGTRIVSNSNQLTLKLISSSRVYPARGFLLKYEAVGCPETHAPDGSFVANDTSETRTFQCRTGNIFPDTRMPTKTVKCQQGAWNETIEHLPNCVATSATILKAESENTRLSSLSGDNTLGQGVRIGRGESADSNFNMDPAAPAMIKQSDYVIDVLLPTILMALLFVGNAVIVYLIFQYRKRKIPLTAEREEMRELADVPQV